MEHKQTLHDVPIFEKLSSAELRLLTDISRMKHYRKSQVIFLEGEIFSGFYVVVKGSVKIFKLNSHGEAIMQHKLGSFRSFAESALFSGSRFYSMCAQAMEDSSLLFFPLDEFTSLLGKNPALAIRISEAFAVRLMKLNRRFDILAADVEGRIARYILNEVELNNSLRMPEPHFVLPVRKKDLAEHLGVASETLSRTLKKFKNNKIIKEVSKKIFITDVKKLRGLASK